MYRFPFCTFKSTVFIAALLLASCGSEVEQETPSNGGGQLVASSSGQVLTASSSTRPVASSSAVMSSAVAASSSVPALVQKSAEEIIDAQCVSCHMNGWHDDWANFDEQQWLAAKAPSGEPLINPLKPEDSLFLRRVSFYADSDSKSNMPLADSPQAATFTEDDYAQLVDWVEEVAAQVVPDSSISSQSSVATSSSIASVAPVSSSSIVVASSAPSVPVSSLASSSIITTSSVSEGSSESSAQVSSSSMAASSVVDASSSENSSSSAAVASSSEVSSSSSSVTAQLTAIEILDQQCTSCHQGFHAGWSTYDESAWLAAKTFAGADLIVRDDILASPLLARINFHLGDDSDMPPVGSVQAEAFTERDYDVVKAWLLTLAVTSSESSEEVSSSSILSSSSEESLSSSSAVTASSTIAAPVTESSSSIAVISSAISVSSSSAAASFASVSSASVEASSSLASSSAANSSQEASSSPAELTALEILDGQCASCHMGLHTGWSIYDEAGWLAAKTFAGVDLINRGDILSSPLLVRMNFYGGADSDMPPTASEQVNTFTEDNYETVKAWLLTLAVEEASSSAVAQTSSEADSESQSSIAELASSSSAATAASSSSSLPSEAAVSSSAVSSAEESSSLGSSSSEALASSMDMESSSSSVSSASSSVDSAVALKIIDDYCSSCHFAFHRSWTAYETDEDWRLAQSTNGESYINPLDPENSFLLSRIEFYGGENADMPLNNAAQSASFTREHYDTLVAWVKSFGVKDLAPITDGTVAVAEAGFTELGVSVELSCEVDEALQLHVRDPERVELTSIVDYLGVTSREAGVTLMTADDVAVQMDDGTFVINGAGLDFWGTSIYFNALSQPITDGALDLTLDVLSVDGVEHDFAKVGLLVTDADDLSGQMVFIHWSGRAGLAEDSGLGTLNSYRRIVANPVEGAVTPAPARLRVAYENDVLKIGGCYGCESPAVGLPKSLNFKPTHVYIVASSHTEGMIQARLGLMDAYSDEGKYAKVHEEAVTCVNGVANVNIPADGLDGLERLQVELYRGDSLVAAASAVKEFSEVASCELQDELLEPKLRRLSQTQIKNSIVDIFGDRFDESIWPDMEDGAKLIGMNNTSDRLNVNNLNMERLLETSKAVARTALISEPTIRACAQAANDDCVLDVVQSYGKRVWRRPLAAAEISELSTLLAEIDSNEVQLEFAINALFLSANFLFRSEIGVLESEAQVLSNYEVASLLSYAVLNTTPDDTLLALADKITPLTSAELQQQIVRLLDDKRADAAMMEVYKDYLKLDLVLSRPKDDSFNFTEAVRADVLASAEQMLIDGIAAGGGFVDVFDGSDYYLNSNIDYLFNATVNNAGLEKTTLDATERRGVLNHPAFLSVHSTLAKSGIVKRGVFALEQLLCLELPDPPDDVMPVALPEGIDILLTSERNLLQMTHSAQSACIGCHQVIDPAGFGFENFDSIGRYRTVEKTVVAIDASGILDNVGEHVLMYNNSAEYSEALMASPQMNRCVSRRFLENFLGQDLERNACELEKYQRHLSEGDGSVSALLTTLIQLESFGKRKQGQ